MNYRHRRPRDRNPPIPVSLLIAPAPAELGAVARELRIGLGAVGSRGRGVAGYLCPDGAEPGRVSGAQTEARRRARLAR